MSRSDSHEDTTKKRKTTSSSVVGADGCGVGETTFAASNLKSNANINAHSKTIEKNDDAVNNAPSERQHVSTYNPLLALAMFVAETEEISNTEDQYKIRNKNCPNGAQISKTANLKLKNGTQTSKTAPPKKKRGRYKDESARESNDEEAPWNERLKDGRIIEAAWNKNYDVLVEYYANHGNSNVPRSYPNKQLSGWVKRQRNNLKDGKLSPCKIVLLNNLDFVWNRTDGQWYKKFCDLVRFQQKFGHCYVTAKYDRSLAEWTQRQRREYKNRPTKIPQERLKKLEALGGWSWDKMKTRDDQGDGKSGLSDLTSGL